MTRRRRTPAWLRICFTVLTLALALLLIGSAVELYLQGLALWQENPAAVIYSPEAVGEKLKLLLPGFVLWLAALAAVLAFHGGESNQSSLIGRAVQPAKAPEDKPAVLRRILLLLAVALILLGIFCGGARDVLVKAANICTECIGLG